MRKKHIASLGILMIVIFTTVSLWLVQFHKREETPKSVTWDEYVVLMTTQYIEKFQRDAQIMEARRVSLRASLRETMQRLLSIELDISLELWNQQLKTTYYHEKMMREYREKAFLISLHERAEKNVAALEDWLKRRRQTQLEMEMHHSMFVDTMKGRGFTI